MQSIWWTRWPWGWLWFWGALFVLTSCAPKIKGWSQEAYRSPDFNARSLNGERLALFPVMVVYGEPAKDSGDTGRTPSAPYTPDALSSKLDQSKPSATTNAYRISLGEALLNKMKSRRPKLEVLSPGDCLKRLNDAGMTAEYLQFDRDFPKVGIDGRLLEGFGQALDCRYVFISQAVVAHVTSEASVTVVWTFGRKSVLQSIKISAQIWDVARGCQVWEGSGIGYNRLGAYEGAPLTEEVVNEAVSRLVQTIIP